MTHQDFLELNLNVNDLEIPTLIDSVEITSDGGFDIQFSRGTDLGRLEIDAGEINNSSYNALVEGDQKFRIDFFNIMSSNPEFYNNINWE